jgi:predicted dehydrogenase
MSNARKTRFAVVGLGHFAQAAILPAFKQAYEKAELAALVTGDQEKAAKLSKEYKVPAVSYEEYDGLLSSGMIEAVYIATPNSEHRKFTEKAAGARVHVLCEKPLAFSSADAEAMVEACHRGNVKLMTAYRLHFEEGNLQAIESVRKGEIGAARLFDSIHTMQVEPDNVRVDLSLGGGPVEDIGVYCINAARYIFQSEPEEVFAFAIHGTDSRFQEVPESVSATMRFPGGRIASFLCGFGQTKATEYRVIGTEGRLEMNPAYTWQDDVIQKITSKGKEKSHTFKHRDQIAAEILYFAECVQNDAEPEPSGEEGLIDVKIIEALRTSYTENRPIRIEPEQKAKRPNESQSIHRPPHQEPGLVNASPPSYE